MDYTLKRQYIVNQITVAPDSTWIEGPVNILDTLHCIPTELIKLKNISKNITRTAELVVYLIALLRKPLWKSIYK